MAGYNFGAFFGGNNNSNSSNDIFSNFNFSDYSSIKNGSYSKLVKSYYAKNSEKASSVKDDESDKKTNTSKLDVKDTTGLSKMKRESDELSSSVDSLNDKKLWEMNEGKYDMEKISSAVKSFADNYNNVITQSSKVNNSDVSKQISNMTSMTSTMSKALSKIGITAGSDGKLSVNEDTLKNANIKDIKAMFDGNHSYASQISKYSNDASKAAVNGSSIYSADGKLSSGLSGMFNDWI